MGLILILVILFLLFGGGGYYGYRRGYYGGRGYGLVWLVLIVLVLASVIGGPRWGWY
jgi:hypothetical protein